MFMKSLTSLQITFKLEGVFQQRGSFCLGNIHLPTFTGTKEAAAAYKKNLREKSLALSNEACEMHELTVLALLVFPLMCDRIIHPVNQDMHYIEKDF